MQRYLHELKDWPDFRWNAESLVDQLAAVRHHQGRLIGRMEALGFNLREAAILRKVLNRLLEGFEGRMSSSKWARLAKCSQDTALRDITDLLDRGTLAKDAVGGRSTSYSLVDA